MSTEKTTAIIVSLVTAALAAGLVIRFSNKKKNKISQKGNRLSGGSQMAGRDINNK